MLPWRRSVFTYLLHGSAQSYIHGSWGLPWKKCLNFKGFHGSVLVDDVSSMELKASMEEVIHSVGRAQAACDPLRLTSIEDSLQFTSMEEVFHLLFEHPWRRSKCFICLYFHGRSVSFMCASMEELWHLFVLLWKKCTGIKPFQKASSKWNTFSIIIE